MADRRGLNVEERKDVCIKKREIENRDNLAPS